VLQNGADARVYRSRIEVGDGLDETIGIKSTASRLTLEDSWGASNASTGCATSGNGVVLAMTGGNNWGPVQLGVLLESSPGSVIEDSDVCDVSLGNLTNTRDASVQIQGDATGVVLRDNHLTSQPYDTPGSILALTDCGGAMPWIVGNTITAHVTERSPPPQVEVIYAAGDCHPLIDSNPTISATMPGLGSAVAVHCGSQGGVDSRCIVSNNPDIGIYNPSGDTSGSLIVEQGTGIQCDGTSCARIDHNHVAAAHREQLHLRLDCGIDLPMQP
jgi:hypothetical protein